MRHAVVQPAVLIVLPLDGGNRRHVAGPVHRRYVRALRGETNERAGSAALGTTTGTSIDPLCPCADSEVARTSASLRSFPCKPRNWSPSRAKTELSGVKGGLDAGGCEVDGVAGERGDQPHREEAVDGTIEPLDLDRHTGLLQPLGIGLALVTEQ